MNPARYFARVYFAPRYFAVRPVGIVIVAKPMVKPFVLDYAAYAFVLPKEEERVDEQYETR